MLINFSLYFLGLYTQCDEIYQYVNRQKEAFRKIIFLVKNFHVGKKFYFFPFKKIFWFNFFFLPLKTTFFVLILLE